MNYATQHYIGNYQPTRTKKTKAVAPTIERVRPLDAKTQRCKRGTERQAEIRTDSNAANGFLRCSFLPKLQETQTVQACKKSEKTERDFYQSLSKLSEHYGIQPIQSRQYGYPYNMALALYDTQEQLRNKVRDWEEIRLMQDSKKAYFTSEERYSTGSTLYYIPVIPLYRLSKNPKRKQAVQLLQSVCSYLYHTANIPYYRQECSYLYWIYEMVSEWVLCDDEAEETPIYISEIKQAEQIGEFMEKKIYSHYNLSRFKERLNGIKIRDSFDHDCFKLACEAFALYEEFPNKTIYNNARPNGEADEDDMENIVSMDKYVSFCADAKGLLFQALFDSVNTELQECGQMEEPIILKRFDGSDITSITLDFENRVFGLIEELIYILNNL